MLLLCNKQHGLANGQFAFKKLGISIIACRYIPFSGGPRKCVGDQFALMEAVVALAILLKRFSFRLVPGQTINMTTGATIHTTYGLYMTVEDRQVVKEYTQATAATVAS